MHKQVKVFEDISELLSLKGAAKKAGVRVQAEDLSIISKAAMISVDGMIQWTGPRDQVTAELLKPYGEFPEYISLGNRTVMPAFVEPHTHLIFAGDRSEEFDWRIQGQSYQDIAARGGGILSTVKATRLATFDQLQQLAQVRANRFLGQGVTLLEVKSGYGLDLESEIKILKVARQLEGPDVVTTFLGPHSRSPDHPDLDSYMKQICSEILPQVMREKLADRADIYIEKGFFTIEQARTYFAAVKAAGLPVTAHVEQLSDFGGTSLALEFQPQSVDHVVFITPQVIEKIVRSGTTAVLLPASDLYLNMRYPPARQLIDLGARVALSTDFNPGTSPTQDLSLVGVLARLEMKMTLAEVIAAFTVGGAHALGREDQLGSLEAGKRCDFLTLEGSYRELFYSIGRHPVHSVWKAAGLIK